MVYSNCHFCYVHFFRISLWPSARKAQISWLSACAVSFCRLVFVSFGRGIIKFEPAHEILALFVLRKLILQTRIYAQPSNGARCLIFGRTHRLLPYFMCANSECSGKTARMRRLA